MTLISGLVGKKVSQPRNHPLKLTKYLFKDKFWVQKNSDQLENIFRKMVREEVEHAIQRSPLSNSSPSPSPYESRQLKLQFVGKLPCKLFTGNKLEAEGPSLVEVRLLDAVSGHLITDGPLSSKKVEIVVLHGHFKIEQLDDWTKREFSNHMLSARSNKRPLLVGKLVITLHNGIGFVDDVSFTDNSSWVRSKMFRLGAQIVSNEDRVREAVSSPFQVKDRRGETYKKHDIPHLEDEVWRLNGIGKDGEICKRLKEHQIYKVQDFVRQYQNDESSLRDIVKVSPRKWNAIVRQATTYFSGQACTNPSNVAQTNNPMAIPCFNMELHSVPPAFQDQQVIQISEIHAGEHRHHQLNQSITSDDSLLADYLDGSCHNVHLPSLDYGSIASSSGTVFNDLQTTSWNPVQLVGEDNNCILMNSSYDSGIAMLSTIPRADVHASATPNPETG